jgi:hypothetical protein
MMVLVAASFWSFMRLVEHGTLGRYLMFGVFAGLGLVSKHSFSGYLLIFLICALLQPALRARVLDWRMLASLGVAGAIIAPFVYWLITERRDLVTLYDTNMAPMASNRLKATAIGLALSIYAPLVFLFPLDAILIFGFPRCVRVGRAAVRHGFTPSEWDQSK